MPCFFRKRLVCAIGLLAGAFGALSIAPARAEPKVVDGVFCDTIAQIEGFAEAHVGAEMSVLDALQVVNKAANKQDACLPMARVIVDDMRDAKDLTVGGTALMVQRVMVVGIMMTTPNGPMPRALPAAEQFVLAKKNKGEEI
jgi:hypothetical protein